MTQFVARTLMMFFYNSLIKKFVLFLIQKNRTVSAFIHFLYEFFSNNYIQTAINFAGTTAIALMTAFQHFNVWLYIIIAMYGICLLFIAWAECYKKEQLIEAKNLAQSLRGMNIVLRKWAITHQETTKKIVNLSPRTIKQTLPSTLAEINPQNAAIAVCENLQMHLTKFCESDDIYITVFQKFQSADDKFICRMIAHSGDHSPSSYDNKYEILKNEDAKVGEIEYHTYIFSKDATDIYVLPNHEDVCKSFKKHNGCEDREEQIQQYIGVPIKIAKQGVTMLLQIDTNKKGLFGKTKEDVLKFAKTAIYPYAQFLHLVYEENKTVQQLLLR